MPMLINTSWLLEYLEPKCSHEDLLDAFPRVGLEIEQKRDLKSELEAVRIGFVLTVLGFLPFVVVSVRQERHAAHHDASGYQRS